MIGNKRFHSQAFPNETRKNHNQYQLGKKFTASFRDVIESCVYKPNDLIKRILNIKDHENFNIDLYDDTVFNKQIQKCNCIIYKLVEIDNNDFHDSQYSTEFKDLIYKLNSLKRSNKIKLNSIKFYPRIKLFKIDKNTMRKIIEDLRLNNNVSLRKIQIAYNELNPENKVSYKTI